MTLTTGFYVKVATACFAVRRLGRRVCAVRVRLDRARAMPTHSCSLSFSQLGACMEMFMIKTGFYDM